jgi:hypothetical protein
VGDAQTQAAAATAATLWLMLAECITPDAVWTDLEGACLAGVCCVEHEDASSEKLQACYIAIQVQIQIFTRAKKKSLKRTPTAAQRPG